MGKGENSAIATFYPHLPHISGRAVNLTKLYLSNNQLNNLPENILNLTNLIELDLNNNPLTDLSVLQKIPSLKEVRFLGVNLPFRYWDKLSDWRSEWLLDEENAEVRRVLVARVGYKKICDDLNATFLDSWREYTLLKIDGVEKIYNRGRVIVNTEPMVLLKMTCPSTSHIHILRVPPEMSSAESAITWVNHGIHPDSFHVQT